MTGALIDRVRRLEDSGRIAPAYVVLASKAGLSDSAALAHEIATHRKRTGYVGPVVVAPEPCTNAEEWQQQWGLDRSDCS